MESKVISRLQLFALRTTTSSITNPSKDKETQVQVPFRTEIAILLITRIINSLQVTVCSIPWTLRTTLPSSRSPKVGKLQLATSATVSSLARLTTLSRIRGRMDSPTKVVIGITITAIRIISKARNPPCTIDSSPRCMAWWPAMGTRIMTVRRRRRWSRRISAIMRVRSLMPIPSRQMDRRPKCSSTASSRPCSAARSQSASIWILTWQASDQMPQTKEHRSTMQDRETRLLSRISQASWAVSHSLVENFVTNWSRVQIARFTVVVAIMSSILRVATQVKWDKLIKGSSSVRLRRTSGMISNSTHRTCLTRAAKATISRWKRRAQVTFTRSQSRVEFQCS